MHVLILPSWYSTPAFPHQGVFFREQALALRETGARVGVAAAVLRSLKHLQAPWPARPSFQDDQGVPTYRREFWGWLPRLPHGNSSLWLRAARGLVRRYFREHGRPDLVHAHGTLYAGVLAARLREEEGIPFVVTELSSRFLRGSVRAWEGPLVRHVAREAGARLAVSPAVARALSRASGPEGREWTSLPLLVDDDFFTPGPPAPQRRDGIIVLGLGSLLPNKAWHILIDAFASAFKGTASSLWLGGDGPERSRLLSLVRRRGIEGQVRLLGALRKGEIREALRACDFLAHPSFFETFGVVLAEALACGKPIVATRCGGPEGIVHDRNGLLVPPGDPAALAGALTSMARRRGEYDPALLRADCLARFGKRAVAGRLLEVYRTVASP